MNPFQFVGWLAVLAVLSLVTLIVVANCVRCVRALRSRQILSAQLPPKSSSNKNQKKGATRANRRGFMQLGAQAEGEEEGVELTAAAGRQAQEFREGGEAPNAEGSEAFSPYADEQEQEAAR